MAQTLLPQAFWFRLAVPCRREDGLPRESGKSIIELSEGDVLPSASRLEGRPAWANVAAAWNPRGLAFVIEAEAPLKAIRADDLAGEFCGAQLWVDTRDTRDVSRATRFCHRFDAKIAPGVAKGAPPRLKVEPRPIARAVADAPLRDPELISRRMEVTKTGWRVELFLPAEVLHGFDPDTNRRLGFAYHVSHPDREGEYLSAGGQFPVGENPSLWSVLELREGTGPQGVAAKS